MTLEQIIFVAVLIVLGSALQSALGFGFGLFAIPLALWAGVSLPMTVTIILLATAVQGSWSCWDHRNDLPWREATPMVLIRAATLPLGVLLLGVLANTDQATIRQVVGVLLLSMIGVQFGLRVQPRPRVHGGWTVLAASSSGVLGGLIGMGGPPLVLWLMAHDWPPRLIRGFHWVGALMLAPMNLALLWLRFGDEVVLASLIAAGYIPLTVGGTVLGLWVGARLSARRLRGATVVVLTLVAVSLILSPMLA